MRRKLLISIVGLALSTILRPIPTIALQNEEPQRRKVSSPPGGKKQGNPPDKGNDDSKQSSATSTKTEVTIQGPITVIQQRSAQEATEKAEEQSKSVIQRLFAPEHLADTTLAIFAFF